MLLIIMLFVLFFKETDPAVYNENAGRDYENDLHLAEILDPNILEGRYFGILRGNDTKPHMHKSFPLVRRVSQLEMKYLIRFLLWVEFAPTNLLQSVRIPDEISTSFVKNRFVVVKNMIPKYLLENLKNCYMDLDNHKLMIDGDTQVRKRHVSYNDRCGRFIHFHFSDIVRAIAHHNVIPTYTYTGLYQSGSVLDPHTDRLACDFTISLNHYQQPKDVPWTLQLGTKESLSNPRDVTSAGGMMPKPEVTVDADLYEGDGLLIMGRHLTHMRRGELPPGHRTHNSFYHYVQSDFKGVLD